jgi:RNA polymerase sigma-70 factor (ECF subfamily)
VKFMLDDSQLLTALRQRDPTAFTQLFEMYSDKVYRLAVGLLEDEDEAEGVVQDTFMRLLERLHQFEGRSKLGTWLYRVAYNLSIDRLRQQQTVLSLADETDEDDGLPMPAILTDWQEAPEAWLESNELSTELNQAVASLPAKLKVVFILREIEGISTEECAQVLAISESAAKVRLHRARLLLRERLAAYVAELV